MTTPTLTESLKQHSHQTHDSVDNLVMSVKPFESITNYQKFLQAQYAFHQAVLPIYQNTALQDNIKNLQNLSRFERVKSDMADLGVEPFQSDITAPSYTDDEAIGWLYCVEGSNVGAAILYKEAGKINLDENKGASHLASHPDGRMRHWKDVKAQIDALDIDDNAKESAKKGADDAFAYFKSLIRAIYQPTS